MGTRRSAPDGELIRIEEIRAANNRLWMDLLRLALRVAPTDAKALLRAIGRNDARIQRALTRAAR